MTTIPAPGREARPAMTPRRDLALFAATLAASVVLFFHASLVGGKVLSPGDVVLATASFADARGSAGDFEPANRLLMDPVLQFQPWLEFSRSELRSGRVPLWNPYAGCGAPHLANGQSAVFDPFHAIAYAGRLPEALGWMAAARLWVAGLGMFLLARSWGLSRWGRWFAGLTYPFCGFLIAWLLYPVTSVAVWMPWLLLATDRALEGPRARGVAGLAVAVGFVMLGGHVQTSAHVLLAAGLYVAWRGMRAVRAGRFEIRDSKFRIPDSGFEIGEMEPVGGGSDSRGGPLLGGPGSGIWNLESGIRNPESRISLRPLARWSLGVLLGLGLAAVEVLPLAGYLARSPAWSDRRAERLPVLAITPPRVLDAATTALPYAFGSQRRGHPNLAKAVGAHNLNESAGGFAGLATLIWLAPSAWSARARNPRVRFLVGLAALGAMGAFGVAPLANLLRALPVLDVADNRRLTLWVAFSLCLLGGIGIDRVGTSLRGRAGTGWARAWIASALLLVVAALAVIAAGPRIKRAAIAHYEAAAKEAPGAVSASYRERAERQARQATTFLPRYYGLAAGHLALLYGLRRAALARRGRHEGAIRAAVFAVVMVDLFAFGYGLNPAISRADDRPESAVIAYLRREVPPPLRVLGIGAELPPNSLMRYGLADARNYDSIELSRSLSWFEPMYEPEPGRPVHTSRRTITWGGAIRAKDRLRPAGVAAIVGASPPPRGAFGRVDRVGSTWIARPDSAYSGDFRPVPGEIRIDLSRNRGQVRYVAETFDPGWKAEIDGRPVPVVPHLGTFLSARIPEGARRLVFRYDPLEFRVAAPISLLSLALIAAFAGAGRTARKSGPQGLDRSGRWG